MATKPTTYTVKAGDTLNAIASQYGFKNYKEANITGYGSGNPDLIRPGEVLTIGARLAATSPSVPNNSAASVINANQQADVAAGATVNGVPSKGETSVSSRYSTAFTDLADVLKPKNNAPAIPEFERDYNKLRKDYGMDGLEKYVNDLRSEEEALFADLRMRRTDERGKPVAMNVIEGRIGEAERQQSERIDYVRRQKQSAVLDLQSANATIENLMNFRKLDYDTARNSYNDQFSQQMQLFNTIKGIVDTEMSEERRREDTSRANLNIIYSAIKDGGIDKAQMTDAMKYDINKLELSAGLPTGFYENIQNQNPGGKILSTTTRTNGTQKYADVLYQNTDGSITAKAVYLGQDASASGGGGGDKPLTEAELVRYYRTQMADKLKGIQGQDGKVSEQDYMKYRNIWIDSGAGSKNDFDEYFAPRFVNPQYAGSYGLSPEAQLSL